MLTGFSPTKPQLDGQVALVAAGTRARSRALAVAYARAGADIALVGANRAKPSIYAHERLPSMNELQGARAGVAAAGRRCLCIEADMLEPEEPARAVADAMAEFGRLDIVVAVAGSLVPVPPHGEPAVGQDELENLVPGAYPTVTAALAPMMEQGFGRIIVVPGGFGVRWRVVGLTHRLDPCVAEHNVMVDVLCPDELREPEHGSSAGGRPPAAARRESAAAREAERIADSRRRKAHREFLEAALLLADPTPAPSQSSVPANTGPRHAGGSRHRVA